MNQGGAFVFICSFKLKWWRVVCFVLLIVIVSAGMYYLTHPQYKKGTDGEPFVKEAQAWQG